MKKEWKAECENCLNKIVCHGESKNIWHGGGQDQEDELTEQEQEAEQIEADTQEWAEGLPDNT